MPKNNHSNYLRAGTVRIARAHFLLVILLAVQTMIYDAWKLVTPRAVMLRWFATGLLLVIAGLVWYLAKSRITASGAFKALIFLLIITDIGLASFNVYEQRGMASRAVFLYAVPIIVSTVLVSRSALFFTALLSVAAYIATAVSYFVLNFNEGYKIELYGEVGFYSIAMLILAVLLWSFVRTKKDS